MRAAVGTDTLQCGEVMANDMRRKSGRVCDRTIGHSGAHASQYSRTGEAERRERYIRRTSGPEIWTTTVETVTTARGPRYRGVVYVGEGYPKNGPAPRNAQVRYTTRLHTKYNEAREQARSRTIHHNVFHDGGAGPDVLQHHRGIRCGEQVAA